MTTDKTLKVTLIRSTAGRLPKHIETVKSLGLRRLHHTVIVKDIPQMRGMINQVSYLVRVEEDK